MVTKNVLLTFHTTVLLANFKNASSFFGVFGHVSVQSKNVKTADFYLISFYYFLRLMYVFVFV